MAIRQGDRHTHHSVRGSETVVCYLASTRCSTQHEDRAWPEGTGWDAPGRTGMFGVAFENGVSIPACEGVAAAVACAKGIPAQRLSRGSGARVFVRQRAAVEAAPPSIDPRHGEGVPDARGRQNCAQAPTLANRAQAVVLEIKSGMFPRFVTACTRAHGFVLGKLRRGREYRGGGLWDPDHPNKWPDQTPATFMF